jgi:hypothetical protein
MSAGTPTDLVRDGLEEAHDPPVEGPSPEPPPKQHWIDVDRLERIGTPPPWQSIWLRVLLVALTTCSVVITLAVVLPGSSPAVGRDETIGQVVFVDTINSGYMVTYTAPGQSNAGGTFDEGVASGSGPASTVSQGEDAVVRYDPHDTTQGTVVSLIPPPPWWAAISGLPYRSKGVGGRLLLVTTWVFTLTAWVVFGYRMVRRAQKREERTDYRDDEWAGSSNAR